MPRRLRFPDLPEGPYRDLMVFVHRIHASAGSPPMRKIAEALTSRGESCSHTTVHKLLIGNSLPANGDLLFSVVDWLHSQNRHARRSEDEILDELNGLWERAWQHHDLTPVLPTVMLIEAKHSDGGRDAMPNLPAVYRERPHIVAHTSTGKSAFLSAAAAWAPVYAPESVVDLVIDGERDSVLPELRTSYATLIGASRFEDPALPDLPSVGRGLSGLTEQLGRPGGPVSGDHITVLEDPSRFDLYRGLRQADQAEDLFLLYYAGHGLVTDYGELVLAIGDTSPNHADLTGIRYEQIRREVIQSRAQHRLVILDCCFSGRAVDELMGPLSGLTRLGMGTAVIASTGPYSAAMAPKDSPYTSFTGTLLSILAEGVEGAGRYLTVGAIYAALRERLAAQGLPAPHMSGREIIESQVLCTNPAYRSERVTEESLAAVTSFAELGAELTREREAAGLTIRAAAAAIAEDNDLSPLSRSVIAEIGQGRRITSDRLKTLFTIFGSAQNTGWDAWEAALSRAELNNRMQRSDADVALLLAVAGGDSVAWEMLSGALARYATAVLKAWLQSGYIFVVAAQLGIPGITPSQAELDQLLSDRKLREDLIRMAIVQALHELRAELDTPRSWRLARDTSLNSDFVNRCVLALAQQFRAHRRVTDQMTKLRETYPSALVTVVSSTEDILHDTITQAVGEQDLQDLPERDRMILWGNLSGYTNAEIAQMVGNVSVRTIEARWAELRRSHPWAATLETGQQLP
ncbi:caspase family protein [Nocardia sp. NPDC059240]|uniref:caspase, EACC1-associated type n=1 Tax=Nocardia sp. NPDC059240 TaxID=3346786 RepID=UPI0036A75781